MNTNTIACQFCQGEGCVFCDAEKMATAIGSDDQTIEIEIEVEHPQSFDPLKPTFVVNASREFFTNDGKRLLSPYTNSQIVQMLVMIKAGQDKALESLALLYKKNGTLFGKQWAEAHLAACKKAEREGLKIGQNQYKVHWSFYGRIGVDFYKLLDGASKLFGYVPTLVFTGDLEGCGTIWRIVYTMEAEPNGARRIWIHDRTLENQECSLCGTIGENGDYHFRPDCNEYLIDFTSHLVQNTLVYLADYGRKYLRCAICDRQINLVTSLKRGFHYECATIYGIKTQQ